MHTENIIFILYLSFSAANFAIKSTDGGASIEFLENFGIAAAVAAALL